MPWPEATERQLNRLLAIQRDLQILFVDRKEAIELLALAAISQEHLLVIGPVGTGKTELIRRFTEMVDAQGFHYLLTRFTEPAELFGPLDLQSFHNRSYRIHTDGMLPQAEILFLDEVFQGSSAILNTLLTITNERMFFNGSSREAVPLISLIGASNHMPEDPVLSAFADRFLLRIELGWVADGRLDTLVERGWEIECRRIEQAGQGDGARPMSRLHAQDLRDLHGCLSQVNLERIRPQYANLIRELRADGIELSDRRVIRALKLVAAAALSRRAEEAELQDLWPLRYVWARPDQQQAVSDRVQARVLEGGGAPLSQVRSLRDLQRELEVLNQNIPHSRTGLTAHLVRLNRLRRELLHDHPTEQSLLHPVEDAIETAMKQLEETTHV